MQLRFTKPLIGWRAFVGEIAIIVIGVLIALGAQSSLEEWRWREDVEIANGTFRDELAAASRVAYERLIIQPCLQGQIRDLSQKLSQSEGLWKASPLTATSSLYLNVMPVVYRAPSRNLRSDGWRNAVARDTVDHLPSKRVRELSALYSQMAKFDELQGDEARTASNLTPLAFDRSLDSRGRTDMLKSLAEVDMINALMNVYADQIIKGIRALNLKFSKAEVGAVRLGTVKLQRATRGACVLNLPFNPG